VSDSGLAGPEFDALVLFNQRHGSRYFTVGYKSLKFTSFVGVVQVGGLAIEILPKADKASAGDTDKWRNALVDMLRLCGRLKLAGVSRADLHLRRASLFDLYMETYLDETRSLLRRGLAKKYRQAQGNLPALKGRLVFGRHLAENLVHRERFFTAYTSYDRDNAFNAILKRGLRIVAGTARAPRLRREAKGCVEMFDDVPDRRIDSSAFERLRYDRNTERYRYAISLARLIILNYQPDVRTGREDVLAILFDMNKLFETYVFQQVRRAAAGCGRDDVKIQGQIFRRFWVSEHARRGLKPDIWVRWSDGGPDASAVLDTKWKTPGACHPDDADLKQMYAYNMQYGSRNSYLLYPQTPGSEDVDGRFSPAALPGGLEHRCGMWFLDLFNENRLRSDLGQEIIGRVLSECGAEQCS
jgi:5-methylcytosine-specific restriction enzyme subunit McrC